MEGFNRHPTPAYTRDIAVGYEEKRARQAAWRRENAILRRWSSRIRPGSTVLDLPCGTGRLFPILFERGLRVMGVDLSEDMMEQIPGSLRGSPLLEGLESHDAADLPYPDERFDYVVSLRLFHLAAAPQGEQVRVLTIPKSEQVRMLKEFMRVADKGVVLHVPVSGSWVSRAADILWRALPWHEGPVYFIHKALLRVRKAWDQLSRKRKQDSRRGPAHQSAAVWSLRELTNAFAEGGFEITKAYGAISPISAKKILVAARRARAAP